MKRPPPASTTFTALPPPELLAPHHDWIERIRLCYGVEHGRFNHEVLRLIERFAAYVHLLPATPDESFSAPGGLLQLGLQTAFYSLQGSDAQIFSGRASVSARHHLEPRWRLAALIAGLCAETHRPLGQMHVSTPNGERWPAAQMPLWAWLCQQTAPDYGVQWRTDRYEQRGLTLFVLPHVLPADLLQYLADGNCVILPHLFASLAGVPLHADTNLLNALVRRAQTLVIHREQAAQAGRHGRVAAAKHLHAVVQDALFQLLQQHPAWQPNTPKARVWWGPDGAFLVWPGAARDLLDHLAALSIPGLPGTVETLLPWLLETHAVHAPADGTRLWTIQPPATGPTAALKLAAPDALLNRLHPVPPQLDQPLLAAVAAPATAPVPPPAAAQLPLPLDAEAPTAAAAEPLPAPPAVLTLHAPLRLQPAVRTALSHALHTLHGTGAAASVCTVAEGLFVPFDTLERQGVHAAAAIRALSETGMLVRSVLNDAPIHQREVHGTPTTGVIIAARFIDGLVVPDTPAQVG